MPLARRSSGTEWARAEAGDHVGPTRYAALVRASHYRRRGDEIHAFLTAYTEFLACVERASDGFREVWRVRPAAETRASAVMPKVAHLAGRAAEAFQESGILIAYKPPGTHQTTTVNPALVWSTLLDTYPMVTPDVMFTVGEQAAGRFESLYDEAEEREHGLAEFLARFVRFPSRVREAAGLEPSTVRGGLVSGIVGVLQGLLVTALGGLLVYPLAIHFGWLK